MFKIKRIMALVVVGVVILSLVIAGCAAPTPTPTPTPTPKPTPTPTPTPSEVITLRFAWNDVWGPIDQCGRMWRPGGQFQRMLYERTDGRIQLDIIPKMFYGDEVYYGLQDKKMDMADFSPVKVSTTYPIFGWFQLPGIIDAEDQEVMEAEQAAIYRDPAFRKFWSDCFREHGLVFLAAISWTGAPAIFTKTKATTLDELRTFKTRAYGDVTFAGLKALEIPVVDITYVEIQAALLTGVLDAVWQTIPFGYVGMRHEVAPYVTKVPFSSMYAEALTISAEVFDNLPTDLQGILIDLGYEIESMLSYGNFAACINILYALEHLPGVEIVELTPADYAEAVETLSTLEAEWLEDAGPAGAELLALARDAVARYRGIPLKP